MEDVLSVRLLRGMVCFSTNLDVLSVWFWARSKREEEESYNACVFSKIRSKSGTNLSTCINLHTYIPTYLHTYITLHYIALHYITLHYITLHYIHTNIHIYIYICKTVNERKHLLY